ncbi:MAG: hypothetical protein HY324_03675, partial [Chlamydiia bacterium]|nr:hypothetical protein [Chlamydiia bacterium]
METKKFENNEYSVEATEESGCLLAVKITATPKIVQKLYQRAVKIVNKQISIPGFRKGHAPDKTVISRHSSYVDQEWKELVLNEAYRTALDLTQIYPLSKESVRQPKIVTCSQEEGAIVTLSYEHFPKIPDIELSSLQLTRIEHPLVSEERITEVLEEVRRANADWEDVEDRAAVEGDFVDVSIESLEEDPPKALVTDRRFEIDDKRISPWLKALLLGLNAGESREGVSELDPNAEERIKRNFKVTRVRVTLHGIKKILLPEVDEEFAKKVSAESIEDLKNKIRANLEQEAEDLLQHEKFALLEKALLERYSFE